ncbi:MAG: hypothetical protein V4504_00650 [Patescibacteria group bacterium]
MKIVTVIPLSKGIFKEELTYFTAKDISKGSIVKIPLRNKSILGVVISSEDASHTKSDIKKMSFNLRKISEVKENSIFLQEFLSAGIEVSDYFASSKSITLISLIPASFREEYDKISKFEKKDTLRSPEEIKNIKPEKLLLQTNRGDRLSYYKTLIRSSFAEKKSIFFILPTEQDVEIFYKELSHGVENFSFKAHGGMSAKKQLEAFKNIMETEHAVLIVASPQFLSIPRNDIKTIVLENESRSSYKMMARPFLDLRIFAELYAQKIEAKFILADTLLRFETLGRREEFMDIAPLSFRLNFEGEIEMKDPHQKIEGVQTPKFQMLSEENIDEIKETISRGENVFIFSLRKGLATITICKDCSTPVSCNHCSSPVVLYLSRDGKKRMFVCNKCKIQMDPEMKCSYCDSWNLTPLGIGTEGIEEEIKNKFPKTKIYKIDKESAKSNAGALKIIKDFEDSKGAILIGTEMAFHYMNEKVPLSIIASFDSLWSIPNFKMSEKILHIIFEIARLTIKKIIIQTKNEKDDVLKAVKNESLVSFVREELADRKSLDYPPYKRFIKVSYLGDKEEMPVAKKELSETFKEYSPELFSGFVSKIKNKYIIHALIKLPLEKWSLKEIYKDKILDKKLLARLSNLPPQFAINVDPEDLL